MNAADRESGHRAPRLPGTKRMIARHCCTRPNHPMARYASSRFMMRRWFGVSGAIVSRFFTPHPAAEPGTQRPNCHKTNYRCADSVSPEHKHSHGWRPRSSQGSRMRSITKRESQLAARIFDASFEAELLSPQTFRRRLKSKLWLHRLGSLRPHSANVGRVESSRMPGLDCVGVCSHLFAQGRTRARLHWHPPRTSKNTLKVRAHKLNLTSCS